MPKNKNCYLTDRGLQLLESALKELPKDDNCFKKCKKTFPKNVNFSKLAKIADIKRHETISNILNRSKGVNKSNIEKVFVAVDILEVTEDYYEDRDYEIKSLCTSKIGSQPTFVNSNRPSENFSNQFKIISPKGGIPKIKRSLNKI